MKLLILFFVLAAVIIVECSHTFLGNSIQRPLVYRLNRQFSRLPFRKRIEYFNYVMPDILTLSGRRIQGILAVDLINMGASANVTAGGLGQNYVNLRLKSGRGEGLHYDIYIYA